MSTEEASELMVEARCPLESVGDWTDEEGLDMADQVLEVAMMAITIEEVLVEDPSSSFPRIAVHLRTHFITNERAVHDSMSQAGIWDWRLLMPPHLNAHSTATSR